MASKAVVQKFDTINKSSLKLKKSGGPYTRTGANAGPNRIRAHGRARRKS